MPRLRPAGRPEPRSPPAGWLFEALILGAFFAAGRRMRERSAGQSREPSRARRDPSRSALHAPAAALERGRGRLAKAPSEIPSPGWKDVLWRTWGEIKADDVSSLARSIAFSGILALFPALAAFVSIYGLFADVTTARDHLAGLTGLIPAEAMTFIGEQMVRIAQAKEASLGLTFVVSLAVSVWSANAGMKALFSGLNIAYEEAEKRNFLRLNLVTLAFTLGAVVFLALAMGALIVLPPILEAPRLAPAAAVLAWLRWPILLLVTVLGLALIYRYGPSRSQARWRWVSYGSVAAAVMWLAGSALFSWYLAHFADYNATYGSLGAVFGFMMWLWLTAVVVLVGAELNSEIEHQTAIDSTTGAPLPMGARGATMADTLGPAKQDGILAGLWSLHRLRHRNPAPISA